MSLSEQVVDWAVSWAAERTKRVCSREKRDRAWGDMRMEHDSGG